MKCQDKVSLLKIKIMQKFFKNKKGFTLIELLIVIALMVLFFALTTPFTMDFYKEQVVEEQTMSVVNTLKNAQSRAQTGKNNSSWGVKFFEDSYILFMGESYFDPERNTSYDKTFEMNSSIEISGVSEIIFKLGTGDFYLLE